MIASIKLVLLFLSSKAVALDTLEIGSRKLIGNKSGYHFSSSDLVSVKTRGGNVYIIGKNVGLLEYEKENQKYQVLVLNKEQKNYFDRTSFIVNSSPHLNWSVLNKKLTIFGHATPIEKQTLLRFCSEFNLSSIQLQIGIKPKTDKEQSCLGLLKSYHLEFAFLNKDKLTGRTYGAGVPSELLCRFKDKLALDEVIGTISAKSNKTWDEGHSFFEGDAELNRELLFESGNEILIRPTGVFTRQQNEWKKALTTFNFKIKKENEGTVTAVFKMKKSKRSGEDGVFSVENFSQEKNIALNKWKKIFVFKDYENLNVKSKLLGFSLLNKRTKSKNKVSKEFWVRISRK